MIYRWLCSLLLFSSLAAAAADLKLIEAMKAPDPAHGPVLRRPKFLTDGSYDTADPSSPIQFQYSDGRSRWIMIFSGGTFITSESLDELLRGGTRPLSDIAFRYSDGSRVTTRPYRINAAPWDPDLASFHDADGKLKWIGYAGMMEKRTDGAEPTRAQDNFTRSRHAFSVALTLEANGAVQQEWHDLGAVHGNQPRAYALACRGSAECIRQREREGQWLTPTHAHGYGSHYIEDASGTPYLFYEQVTEQKNGGPYRTEIFVRRLSADRTRGIGDPLPVLKVAPWNKPDLPFQAAKRSIGGFLIEGPHLTTAKVGGKEFYLLFFSAGDAFTDKYGNHVAYREKARGLYGPFTPVTKADGELVDVTGDLTQKIDGTWGIGRLNPFWDERGQLWGAAHVILKSEIPEGEVKSGWPPTYEELVKRARRTLLVPLAVTADPNGHPSVVVAPDTP